MFPLLPARHLSSRFILLHLINMIGLEYTAGGGILMSPHRDRSVAGMILSEESAYESATISGKTDKMTGTSTTPVVMVKNPNDRSPTQRIRQDPTDRGTECRSKESYDFIDPHEFASFSRFGYVGNAFRTDSYDRGATGSLSLCQPQKPLD